MLFPFETFWPAYVTFILFVLFLLALDLGVFHKKAHEVSFKESALWTGVWISLALVFNVGLYFYAKNLFLVDDYYKALPNFNALEQAKTVALEFLTGFVIEKSLAIDNIFVFALVFAYFKIPSLYQHRILFWGIFGALFFRAVFIAIGAALMKYEWIIWFFGGFLILTGVKMFFAGDESKDLESNKLIQLLKKLFKIHPHIEGDRFFIIKDKVRYVTPLFLALVFLELSDIVFAIDSVPAIFSITKEPFIVFTSNIFAILGLRSMYFMLAGVMDRFAYIKYGLAAVLVFVGLKMVYLNHAFGGKFPIGYSLLIIAGLIGGSMLYSVWVSKKHQSPSH